MTAPAKKLQCAPKRALAYTAEMYVPAQCIPEACELIVPASAIKANCDKCGFPYADHAHCDALVRRQIVCPGNLIVTHPDGSKEQMRPDMFKADYELVAHKGTPWPKKS